MKVRKNGQRGARGKRGPFSKSDEGTNRRQTLVARKSNQHGGGRAKSSWGRSVAPADLFNGNILLFLQDQWHFHS